MKTAIQAAYEAFGLTIRSDIPLPELPVRSEGEEGSFDISITIDQRLKEGFSASFFNFVVEGRTVTVKIPDVGVFRIRNGEHIAVSPFPNTDEDLIRLYVLGSCFGALLLQRGVYPLHGSAVAIGGKAYAFVGDSGAGKSTLASALMERGCRLLSDDVIAVSLEDGEPPQVIPSYPQQKLWRQSLDAFGVSAAPFRPIYGREHKFCVPVADKFDSERMPLAGLFELVKSKETKECIEPISKLERLQKLYRHTYRQFLVPKMGLMGWHFLRSSRLAHELPFHRVMRTEDGFHVTRLVDMVLDTIHKEERR